MLNTRSRRRVLNRKSGLLLYVEMKDAIEKVRASGGHSFSRASSACEYWRRPAVNAGVNVSRHRKGVLMECAETNVVCKNDGNAQQDIDLRWDDMDSGCLRAFFFEDNCDDEMGNFNGTPIDVNFVQSKKGYGKAAQGNGDTSRIGCGSGDDIDNLTTFTVAFTMNPASDGEGNAGRIFDKSTNFYACVYDESGEYVRIQAIVRYDGDDALTNTERVFKIGKWCDIAITYDEAGDRMIHIYKNGAEVPYSTQQASTGNRNTDASEVLRLLNRSALDRGFDGAIDRFLIYNRVLSHEEIKRLTGNAIVALWNFEDNCHDEIGLHHGKGNNVSFVSGENGKAAAFLQSDSLVNAGNSSLVEYGNDLKSFSIRAKIKVPSKPSATSTGRIAHKSGGGGVGWQFGVFFDEDGMRLWGFIFAATTNAHSESTTKIDYNTWYDLTFSYDDFGDRKVHIYIGGSEVTYTTQDAAVGTLSWSGADIIIGNASTTLNRCLYGYIERLALYRRPLVSSELSGGELLCMTRGYKPILGVTPGAWDNAGIRDAIPLRTEAGEVLIDNGQYVLYYSGKSGSGVQQIGRAVSDDGIHWTKSPADSPVLSPGSPGAWDDTGVYCPSVIKMNDGGYRMYYCGRDATSPWSLGMATSTDGINFTKYAGNPIATGDGWNSTSHKIGVPFVTRLSSGQWVMTFESQEPFRCYMGLSNDGITWTPADDGNAILEGDAGEWDSTGTANPKLFELAPDKYLLGYNGRNEDLKWSIGFAYSTDLVNWTKFSGNPVMECGPAEWDAERIENAFIAKQDVGTDTVRMWYFGGPDSTYFRIGYATCPQESMDIFGMIDVTGWQRYVEPNLYGGHSVQLCETGGETKQYYQVKTLTAEDYVVSFLAYTDGSEVSSADVVPFADTAFTNEISDFHYEDQGGGVYLCWGVFTATAADWNVGVEVKANRRACISLLTCAKAGTSKASGPYPRSPIVNDTTAGIPREAESLTVAGSSNFDGKKGTLDVEFYPLFASSLPNSFELCFAHLYGGAGEIKLYRDSVDEVKFRVQGDGDEDTVTGTINWNRGDRVRIRLVWNSEKTLDGENYMLMYGKVNGGDWSQIGACLSQPTAPSSDQTLYIGRAGSSAGYEANSFLSWLRIYDHPMLNPAW